MNIAVIGTGYVGLVTGTVLAQIGHTVSCIDIDTEKIAQLQQGNLPIHEPGLEELLQTNCKADRLSFTTDHKPAFKQAKVIFIAVGTPQGIDGQADLTYLEQAAKDIARFVDNDVTVVIKSTVPPGTNDYIEEIIRKQLTYSINIHVVSNPEFLREGRALHDTFHGDRIIIGSQENLAGDIVETLFAPLQLPIVRTDRRSAEMIKYAANAFLAVKISYINEIAALCDEIGADVTAVAEGMGMDKRIGREFLNAGIGYGGSCFPKDTEAIAHLAKQKGTQLGIVESAIKTNRKQRYIFVDKIMKFFNGRIAGKKIAVLGLSFKPDTDDMREAPSMTIIEELEKKGAYISAYDPIVSNQYSATSLVDCVRDANAVLLVTEWQEFIEADWTTIRKLVKEQIIFDGRNALHANSLQQDGWAYIGIGKDRSVAYGFQKN